MLLAWRKPGIAGGRIWEVRRPPYFPEIRTIAGRSSAQLIACRYLTLASGCPGRLLSAQYEVTEVGFTKKRLLLTPNSSLRAPADAAGTPGSQSAWPAFTCRMLWFR